MINEFILKTYRTIMPKVIQKRVKEIRKERREVKYRKNLLKEYECVSGAFPGFIALQPYVKTDRIFDGVQYYAQFYQDFFLDKYIFRKKESGFFLDVGGNDPIYINNTYFFEKNRGWNGLAFEPMPDMNNKWKEERKAECIQAAVGCHEGKMQFCEYADDYMSGISDVVDYNGKIKNSYKVDVVEIGKVLAKKQVKHVDFMSIDIEGAELDALKGIDFENVVIDYIVIENNKGKEKENAIREFLIDKGYKLIARLWIDDVWEKIKE